MVALAIWSTTQGQTGTESSVTPSKSVAVYWCICGYVSVCRDHCTVRTNVSVHHTVDFQYL